MDDMCAIERLMREILAMGELAMFQSPEPTDESGLSS